MYQTDRLQYCILMIKKELLVNWHILVVARPVHFYYYDRLLLYSFVSSYDISLYSYSCVLCPFQLMILSCAMIYHLSSHWYVKLIKIYAEGTW
jgi:hypothetical protein